MKKLLAASLVLLIGVALLSSACKPKQQDDPFNREKIEQGLEEAAANGDEVPEEPAEEPVEEPAEEPAEEPVEEPAEEPAKETTD